MNQTNGVLTIIGYPSGGGNGGCGYIEIDDKEFLFIEIKKVLTTIFNNIDFNQKTEQIEIRDLQNMLNLIGSILNKLKNLSQAKLPSVCLMSIFPKVWILLSKNKSLFQLTSLKNLDLE